MKQTVLPIGFNRSPGLVPLFLACIVAIGTGSTGFAHSREPMEVLRRNVERAVAVLDDPRYTDGNHREEQREILCSLAREGFDFFTFVRLSLAYDLEKFTSAEVSEFTELFIRFLCRFYITQLQERYSSEQVLFQKQAFSGDTRARVRIAILWRNVEIPVTVFMNRTGGTWKAYDVSVFGIGAVQNYRQQIHEVLEDITPAELIALVRKKLAENPP